MKRRKNRKKGTPRLSKRRRSVERPNTYKFDIDTGHVQKLKPNSHSYSVKRATWTMGRGRGRSGLSLAEDQETPSSYVTRRRRTSSKVGRGAGDAMVYLHRR